ncbi:hypothetical protein B0H14DRAFT_3516550 [Mycena olivaceomarginata]|nr:hypothetical protein B0H14DRAFT_3516550 [Mycena olivaceomarginata]
MKPPTFRIVRTPSSYNTAAFFHVPARSCAFRASRSLPPSITRRSDATRLLIPCLPLYVFAIARNPPRHGVLNYAAAITPVGSDALSLTPPPRSPSTCSPAIYPLAA